MFKAIYALLGDAEHDIVGLMAAKAVKDITDEEDRRALHYLFGEVMEVLRTKLKKMGRPALLRKALGLVDDIVRLEGDITNYKALGDTQAKTIRELRDQLARANQEAYETRDRAHKAERELSRANKIIDRLVGHA